MNRHPSMTDDVHRNPIARLLARLERPGLSRIQERVLNLALVLVTLLLTGGWGIVVVRAVDEGTSLAVGEELARSPLSSRAPPPAAFLLERLVEATRSAEWRGRSGAVRAIIADPAGVGGLPDTLGLDSLPAGARIEVQQVDSPGVRGAVTDFNDRPGVFNVLVRLRNEVQRLADVAVLNPVPSDLIEQGRIGRYLIGEWPSRSERPERLRTPEYDQPTGLIAVTPSNRDVRVTDHLTLGDFLTKGQDDVWPKYVAITPALLDKVELTIQELERMGHDVEDVGIISGFRTPWYNAHGGSTGGRGSVSRHMYGDALDFYIDNDGDGALDDLDGDGRITRSDAAVLAEAADAVEQRFPEYVGGVGTYGPNPGAHSGFVHVDARGYRARW
jgi:uncharacterized protein YcbK (DUF882 family)